MKRILVCLSITLLLVCLVPLTLAAAKFPTKPLSADGRPTPTPTPKVLSGEAEKVHSAILASVTAQRENVLGFLVYEERVEEIKFSQDQSWARAWLIMIDPQTGEPVPTEPGLVLVQREGDSWRVFLPEDPDWLKAIMTAPADLIADEERAVQLEMYSKAQVQLPTGPLTGYLLPWAAGETRYLSQSVGHDQYTPSGTAHFAFDFYVHETLWPIYAAKSGIVWWFKYDVPTCYENHCDRPLGNYIVLQDPTTNPVSYQLYLHLAFESIPPSLRERGAPVVQGQFIGIADNTGQSYGDHLHFMVHTNPASYWGQSVDILFSNVDINGGRPRVSPYDPPYCLSSDVCNTFRVNYVSANIPKGDITPPFGDITSVGTGSILKAPSLFLSGYAHDLESGFYSAQFVVNYNGAWHNIGPLFTSSLYNYTWGLCADNVPNGVVSIAMRLQDKDGNVAQLAGLRHIIKNYACPQPPPACTPDLNQVALSKDPNYAGCVLFEVGDYGPSLGQLGDNDAVSIQVGANVMATLYAEANFQERSETFLIDDPNLSDNRIGAGTASSMKVQWRSQLPLMPALVYPLAGSTIPADTSVSLAWEDGGGGTEFQGQLSGGVVGTITSNWMKEPVWHLGSIVEGTYTWQARSLNANGMSDWSQPSTFSLPAPSSPPDPKPAPYSDDMETSESLWAHSGFWRWLDINRNHSWWYQDTSGNYDNGQPNAGSLTSPPITIPTGPVYYLRFTYQYKTESKGAHWDQRRVQVSVDGGPFTNLLQFSDDVQYGQDVSETTSWIQSPAINLAFYAGHTIRVRFHFETLDAAYNNYIGWGVDDFSITTTAPPVCSDGHEPNNAPGSATVITDSQLYTANGEICPNGDVDYYRFNGTAGAHIIAAVDAQTLGSPLDPYLFLLDSDGTSVLSENDDIVPGVVRDSHLEFTLSHDGTYYLKVRAWKHPGVGGPSYSYILRLSTNAISPAASITSPTSGSFLTTDPVKVTALVTDTQSGISRVDFYWHSWDWLTSDWEYLGSDTNPQGRWSYNFSLPSSDQKNMAFYINAFNNAGAWIGAGAWNLGVDRTPPVTAMKPISPTQSSTAFLVKWSGTDAVSGIDHYDLQWSQDAGATWGDYASDIPGYNTQTWVIGEISGLYGFRLRGVDRVGNTETYPSTAEVSTFIPNTICSSPDTWENDNTPETARQIIPGGAVQIHNFCNPATTANWLNDEDWITFTVQTGVHYQVRSFPLAANVATHLSLYTRDGVNLTLHADASPADFGQPIFLEWTSDRTGVVYVRMSHMDGRVAGNPVAYRVEVITGYRYYFPELFK